VASHSPAAIYKYEDSTSPTGIKPYVPDSVASEEHLYLFKKYGNNLRPTRIMTGLTGYSPLAPIFFEVPTDIDIARSHCRV